ncbi:hypothetical protein [Desulfonema magnum]|uniref:Diaminopimelate epimerase n=1 Tax=Desulfonema magnum TaxID=45655 RepID=A0A975BY34_9BACT|nr:hypothetical protein [Desulfonema magnum]QTA93919.1 Putative diaminopimelate epimerase [Desulfonema magnum]
MKKIPFIKYTLHGNNFVIVDEVREPILAESEKPGFAYCATDMCYGIGSDNMLVVQPFRPETLKEINSVCHYWDRVPDLADADYIFRMFEPGGEEAFSCGNGLMCIANYLYRQYNVESAKIITEIPTSCPKVITIGTNLKKKTNWANMGHPRRISPDMAKPSVTTPYDREIDKINSIKVNFRRNNGFGFINGTSSLTLSGYLVFTGEPHFVIFTNNGFSAEKLLNKMFLPVSCEKPTMRRPSKNGTDTGSQLVHYIGTYFKKEYAQHFPAGLNIDFVNIIDDSGILEYRCFERGINHETLACGTGAVAASFVARRLNMLTSDQITVWPYRSRCHNPDAKIYVRECVNDWLLYGKPVLLCEGTFMFDEG